MHKCITLKHATSINAFLFLKSPMKPFFFLLLLENQLLNNANKNMCGAYISEKNIKHASAYKRMHRIYRMSLMTELNNGCLTLIDILAINSSVSVNLGTLFDSHRNCSASSINCFQVNCQFNNPQKVHFAVYIFTQYHVKYAKVEKLRKQSKRTKRFWSSDANPIKTTTEI